MNPYATKLAEAFAATIILVYFENTITPMITNGDYEGEVKDKATVCNIPTVGGATLKNYTGADLTADDVTESAGQLLTNQAKAYYFKVKDFARLESFIKQPEGSLLDQLVGLLNQTIDAYVLGLYTKAGAGNRDGTDYVTGTVAVAATTGVVTGSSTTFTSAMVGRGFKAAGHTKWYRVLSYSSTTSITIGNDVDDVTAFYDGGAISGGATYTIEAVTGIAVTKSNIYAHILNLDTKLNQRFAPKNNRWLALNSAIAALLRQAPEFIPSGVPAAYEDVVKNGFVVKIAGFDVYQNEQVAGDAVNGYRILAGHKSAITFGMALTESEVEAQIIGNFGKAYKGLNVYGAKVVDERRKVLAEGFWIPTAS